MSITSTPATTTSAVAQFVGPDVKIAAADGSVGFFGVDPIAQPAAIANCTVAADGTSAGTQLNLLLAQLRLLGIIAAA